MTHKNDEGGEGRWQREDASEVGGERKLSKKEEDAETKCKKRRKRGKEQNINEGSPLLAGFLSSPFPSSRGRKQAIHGNSVVLVLLEPSHSSCQASTLHGSSFYFYILQT